MFAERLFETKTTQMKKMNEIEPDLLNISESDSDLIKKLFPGRVRLDGELQLGVDGRHADVDLLRHPEV